MEPLDTSVLISTLSVTAIKLSQACRLDER